jgi:hypothetical protein
MLISACFLFILQMYQLHTAVKAAQRVAGDISRRKKVKEKRPSPLLCPKPLKGLTTSQLI